jgi:hypothetical protein
MRIKVLAGDKMGLEGAKGKPGARARGGKRKGSRGRARLIGQAGWGESPRVACGLTQVGADVIGL